MYLTDDATIITMVAGKIQKGQNFASVNPRLPDKSDKLVESAVRIRMVGANPHPKMTGLDPLPGHVNYLVGDEKNFHRDVETFARVKIANVYPGVDIIHYGSPNARIRHRRRTGGRHLEDKILDRRRCQDHPVGGRRYSDTDRLGNYQNPQAAELPAECGRQQDAG